MAFHFRREPLTQHLLLGGLLACAVTVGSTKAAGHAWAALIGALGPRWLVDGGLLVIHTTIFWSVCGLFHLVDVTDRPRFIARHRIQSGPRRQPPLRETLRVLGRNQILLVALIVGFAELLLWRGWRPEPQLPSLLRLALELAGQAICAILVFYGSHRLLHRKWWLKRVHRVHHEFRTSSALASEYAHPVELAISNFGTLALGALLIAPHLASMYLFAILSLLTILVHHSGYALPWAPWSVPHDWHHHQIRELFGATGLLDRILGTDRVFRTLRDGDVR